jgi:hypothetical protein
MTFKQIPIDDPFNSPARYEIDVYGRVMCAKSWSTRNLPYLSMLTQRRNSHIEDGTPGY